MKSSLTAFAALTLLGLLKAQYVELPQPLFGNGVGGTSNQGTSLALSADGNTALTGAPGDNGQAGAAWVFIRTAGMWTQQGSKLVGSGAVGTSPTQQGYSVALSADGNTGAFGGLGDNNGAGAVWVFTRSGGVWTQQGGKLTAGDEIGSAELGISVAISADGNTIAAGGLGDNGSAGAVWVFTRSGAAWTQQGNKLVGTGAAIGHAGQGSSVALSADGNTLFDGAPGDNSMGAVWVFTRSGGVWTQQGPKLVGTGAVGTARQGFSVALSGDGNTALEGGPGDTTNNGAAWVFTRSAGIWTQQGNKLVGNEAPLPGSQQGASVALTSDGNRAMVGAPGLRGSLPAVGAAFVYARDNGVWRELTILESGSSNGATLQGASVAISAVGGTALVGGPGEISAGTATGAVFAFILQQPRDFNADGRADALLYDPVTGTSYAALSNGDGTYQYVYNLFTPGFDTLRTGDFIGDIKAGPILYNSQTGLCYFGLGNGNGTFAFQPLFWSPGYDVVEVGPLQGFGLGEIALYNSSTGTLYTVTRANLDQFFVYEKQASPGLGFTLARIAYFSNPSTLDLHLGTNGRNQLLLYNPTNGMLYLAFLSENDAFQFEPMGVVPGDPHVSPGYDQFDVGDVNGDGYADIILYNSANGNAATGIGVITSEEFTPPAFSFTPLLFSPGFTAVRLADFTGDGKADLILYNKTTGMAYFGTGDGTGNFTFQSLFWSPGYDTVLAQDVNGDGKADVLLYNSATGTLYTGIGNGDGTFNYTYSYWGIGKLLAQ